jgi:hypothetical protein
MMGMKMKKAKTEPKLDAAEEITPEQMESVTPTTDIEDAAGAAGEGLRRRLLNTDFAA